MDDIARAAEPCDMDWTPDTQEENFRLSRLGPKRKPRRRSLPLRKYDQLVALAEANAQKSQKRHDALYGPSPGAEQYDTSAKPSISQADAVDIHLDLHTMD